MKKKRPLRQSDMFWGLAAASLVLLQFWWLPGEDGSVADSYSTTVDGKLGLYRMLSELFPRVERDAMHVVPGTPASMLLIAPDRYPGEKEEQQIRQFVYDGGNLLFAPNENQLDVSFPSLGIFVTSDPGLDNEEVTETGELVGPSELIESAEAVETTSFRNRARVNLPSHDTTETLLQTSGRVTAATWTMGAGRIVVCSSPDLFSNRSMLFKDSRRLAVRLVERCVMGVDAEQSDTDSAIVMNEYFNASDSYRNTGVLLSPVLRIGTLQLLLVAVLGIWLAFHRFGPAIEVSTTQRRSLTESAQAIGNLQYRLRDGGASVRAYLDYLRSQLRRRYGSQLRLDQAEALALRADMDTVEVREKLKEAQVMAESSQLSASRAAAMLRWLSLLHQRLLGSRA